MNFENLILYLDSVHSKTFAYQSKIEAQFADTHHEENMEQWFSALIQGLKLDELKFKKKFQLPQVFSYEEDKKIYLLALLPTYAFEQCANTNFKCEVNSEVLQEF